jgi:acyl-coenzyme A synthetase/AMP-(fatty) acid ligase
VDMNPPKNIGLWFDWHAARKRSTRMRLDRPFDIAPQGGRLYDAESLAELVREASGWLYEVGVRRGDKVAVIKNNHFDFILLSAAAARVGAVAATISAANQTDHLAQLIARLKPTALVTTTEVLTRLSAGGGWPQDGCRALLIDGRSDDTISIDDLRGSKPAPVSLRGDSEPMMITHSSGTTGVPKFVVHTADTNRGATRLELLPLPVAVSGRRDVVLSSISYAHSRAYTWTAAQFRWAPAELMIASTHQVSDVEQLMSEHKPTIVETVPNVFQHWLPLVRRRPELFTRVRYYMNTFDLMHPSIARPFMNASQRRLVVWGHSWGQSETGPIAGNAYFASQLNKIAGTREDNMNNMGFPWPGLIKAKIVDPTTRRTMPRHEVGDIVVKSGAICVDYLGETDRHRANQEGQWWKTGDVGYRDRMGRIHFVGRAVDAIPNGSETELESVLLERIPGASEVVILSRGQQSPLPVLCVDGDEPTDEIWKSATADLPPLGQPVVLPWDELPRTSTWKVNRARLKEQLLESAHDHASGGERSV